MTPRTMPRFPVPPPLPPRLITLDCPCCETPTPFAETASRDALVCGLCGYEYQRITMDYPPLEAYSGAAMTRPDAGEERR